RWARLRIPNGQAARTFWKEGTRPNARRSRNVKFLINNNISFREVQYLFRLQMSDGADGVETLAIVSLYSPPDRHLLEASQCMLWSVEYLGSAALQVIPAKSILSVVAMIPHTPYSDHTDEKHFFVVEKPGLDVADMGGYIEQLSEADDQDL
ncbi:hypothetical protein EDB19DRAFT_1624652, partial [Suillus lakei]